MTEAVDVSPDKPVLIDKFLEDAIEVDVDAISDGEIDSHRRQLWNTSKKPECTRATPPVRFRRIRCQPGVVDEIRVATRALWPVPCRFVADEYSVRRQGRWRRVRSDTVYVLEVNPRASRTSPFVSKAIGRSLAKIAAKVMVGVSLKEQGFTEEIVPKYTSVKESVFPFNRFMGVDIVLGPGNAIDRRSHGHRRRLRSGIRQGAAGGGISRLPMTGKVFISMAASHKERMIEPARRLKKLGYQIGLYERHRPSLSGSGH